MRRSLLILATLAMSSALYAQADTTKYTREKVLDIFSQYNPTVLEYAAENADYNAVLEGFASSYNGPETDENRYELIAVARNFDNSLRLQNATMNYENAVILSRLSGNDLTPVADYTREQLTDVFQKIWAVTVQLRELQLKETQANLKALKKDKTLLKEDRQNKEAALREQVRLLKAELKNLKKDTGDQIVAAVNAAMSAAEDHASQQAASLREEALKAMEAQNLQIKSNHKKPVAK